MALLWCTEALPLAVTALFPIVLFPLMGIMEASEVSTPIHKRKDYIQGEGKSSLEPWNQRSPITRSWQKAESMREDQPGDREYPRNMWLL